MTRTLDPLGIGNGQNGTYSGLVFVAVSYGTFAVHYEGSREVSDQIREATSPFAHVDGTVYVLTSDCRSGYAVRPDGELVFVFSEVRGRGDALARHAVMTGADHLDCFDGYLPTFYARHGFRETRREENWTVGQPDVVYMSR